MGRCTKCYGQFDYIPGMGVCNSCRNSVTSYTDSRNNSSGQNWNNIKLSPKAATVVCWLLGVAVVAAIVGVVLYMYNSNKSASNFEEIVNTLSDKAGKTAVTEVLGREDDVTNWEISVRSYKNGFFNTLFNITDCEAEIERSVLKDGTEMVWFNFDGNDLGVGLEGEYAILTVEGKRSLLDKKNELIYQKGSDFFDTYYPKLKALTYDAVLEPAADAVKGGQYGTDDKEREILQNNNAQMVVESEQRAVFTLIDDGGYTYYVADAFDSDTPGIFEMLNYKIHGKDYEDLDELGKLLVDGDYSVSIEKYVDDEQVYDLRYERNLKEHSIEFKEDYEQFKKGTYVFTEDGKSITYKVYNNETYNVDEITYSVAKNKKMYQELMALIPDLYVRRVMDLNQAKKAGFLGINTYTMKDKNGDKIAILSTAFGKINKLIHYVSDNERMELSW